MKNLKCCFYSALMLPLFSCETERIDSGSASVKEYNNSRQKRIVSNEEMIRKGLHPQLTINGESKDAGTQRITQNKNQSSSWVRITKEHLESMKDEDGNHFNSTATLKKRFEKLRSQDKYSSDYNVPTSFHNNIYIGDHVYKIGYSGVNTYIPYPSEEKNVYIGQSIERKNRSYDESKPGELQRLLGSWTDAPGFATVCYANYDQDAPIEMGGFNAEGWKKEISNTLGWHVTLGTSASIGGKKSFFGLAEKSFNFTVSLEAGAEGSNTTTHSQSFFLPPVKVPKGKMVTYMVMKRRTVLNIEFLVHTEFRGLIMANYYTPSYWFTYNTDAYTFFYDYHKTNPSKIMVSYPVEEYIVDYFIDPIS